MYMYIIKMTLLNITIYKDFLPNFISIYKLPYKINYYTKYRNLWITNVTFLVSILQAHALCKLM